jgi:hypothetical protein
MRYRDESGRVVLRVLKKEGNAKMLYALVCLGLVLVLFRFFTKTMTVLSVLFVAFWCWFLTSARQDYQPPVIASAPPAAVAPMVAPAAVVVAHQSTRYNEVLGTPPWLAAGGECTRPAKPQWCPTD